MNISTEYYGVGAKARATVERLLNLQPLCAEDEQEWEFRLADPACIDDILDLLESRDLDLEMRSAFAQLLMGSIDVAVTKEVLSEAHVVRAAAYFATDSQVRARMVFFWLEKENARNCRGVASVLFDPAVFRDEED